MNASHARRRAPWALPMLLLALAALVGAAPARAQFIQFDSQPSSTVSGQPINSTNQESGQPSNGVTITDYDVDGNPIMGALVTITLNQNFNGGPGQLTTSTSFTGLTDASGQLTFVGLMIDKTGTYQLTATDPTNLDENGNATSGTSDQFQINPGPFSGLVFTQQPVNAPLGFALNTGTNPQGVVVTAEDAAGNALDGTQPAVTVTVALGPGSTGTLTGTNPDGSPITGGTAMGTTNGSGSIAFTALTINKIGSGDTLVATGTSTSGEPSVTTTETVTSQPFAITQFSDGVVTSTKDDGSQGTLRSVLADVPPGTTVTFDPTVFPPTGGPQTINLGGGEIDVPQSVTVIGPSPAGVFVDGQNRGRVFGVTGGPVSMSDLIIVAGQAPFSGPGGEGAPFFGQGGGVAVSGTGILTLTRCTLSGDDAYDNGAGGGVYNAGALALVDCTINNDTAAYDGGGVFSDGAAFLVGCAVYNNTADNNGSGGDGGGVFSDGQALTITSCSFNNNRADQGYDVFNLGGGGTLTDDILYGGGNNGGSNNANPTEIGGSNLVVNDCDVQGGSGQQDSHGNSLPYPGSGNVDFNPEYDNGSDLRLNTLSQVIGRGTSSAPGFRATDHDGNLYFNAPSLGAFEGALDEPTTSHALWTNPDGRTIVWDLPGQTVIQANGSPANNYLIVGNYGPQDDGVAGYTAVSLATSPVFNFVRGEARPRVVNNSGGATPATSYVLWNAPDGRAMLWAVNDANGAVTRFTYGPFADGGSGNTVWQATAVSVGGDGTVHVLWDNPNGRTILWDVNPADGSRNAGAFTVRMNYGGFSDDGTANTVWKAVALASGPDGLNHILFNNADNHTLLWNLDNGDDQPVGSGNPATASQTTSSTFSTYGTFSDDGSGSTIWKARALSVGPDNVPHLLWNNPDGRTIFWRINRDGSFGIVDNFGPAVDGAGAGGFTAVGLATSADNQSHLGWDNANGETLFREVNQDGTFADVFFPPFMDDGTTGTLWHVSAVSAAESANNFD